MTRALWIAACVVIFLLLATALGVEGFSQPSPVSIIWVQGVLEFYVGVEAGC